MIRASASQSQRFATLASRSRVGQGNAAFFSKNDFIPRRNNTAAAFQSLHPLPSSPFLSIHNHNNKKFNSIQKRSYIFLPSSLNDATKLVKTLLDSTTATSHQHQQHLTLKLQTRYQDTLSNFRQKLQKLREMKQVQKLKLLAERNRDKYAATKNNYTANYYTNHATNYANSMRSIKAWNNGKKFLVSHMNAKRRVYARRRAGRQAARLAKWNFASSSSSSSSSSPPMKLSTYLMEKVKAKYSLGKERWMGKIGNSRMDNAIMSIINDGRGRNINQNSNNNTNNEINNKEEKYGNNTPITSTTTTPPVPATTVMGITLTEPSQQSWFDSEGYPLTSRDPETGRFVNPWLSESTNGENGLKKFLRWKFGRFTKMLDDFGILRWNAIDDIAGCGVDTGVNNSRGSSVDSSGGMGNRSKEGMLSGSSHDGNGSKKGSSSMEACYSTTTMAPSSTSTNITATPIMKGTPFPSRNPINLQQQLTKDAIRLTWIGHSTTLVRLPGNFTILTDPHFSNYAGPMKRNVAPGLDVMDLPEVVDVVLISHDHYDHLDYWSILQLVDSNKVQFWAVPLGLKDWLMNEAGVSPEDIVELEWWEGVRISKAAQTHVPPENCGVQPVLPEVEGLVRAFENNNFNSGERKEASRLLDPEKNEMTITCAPAQHWCSRTPFDRNKRLWCSWAVHTTTSSSHYQSQSPQSHSFYFAGDTGLPSQFPLHRQIGDRLGPFDLAAIPIGAYEPRWFMREAHCDPSEAVKIHQAIRARKSVAIHFDTFDLADEPREEPPQLLMEEVGRVNADILRIAAEVVSVAEEVGIVDELETVDGAVGGEVVMEGSDMAASRVEVERAVVAEVGENLVEMLPPLVDFAVIQQGQSVETPPKAA